MIALVVNLHFPDGKIARNQVVESETGIVLSVSDFVNEVHSMMLLQDAYIMPSPLHTENIKNMHTHYLYNDECACIFIKMPDGGFSLLSSCPTPEFAADDCCGH